ncbi:MAG: DUF7847 domain-containing protein [Candidatus Bathyarchaeia archaeon]
MDVISESRRAAEILRSNLILFLPSIITFYLIPIIILIGAVYTLTPIIYVILKTQSEPSTLHYGLIFGFTVAIVLAALTYIYVLSGAANMNKKAVLTGSTSMSDFWEGCDKYFIKILAGSLLLAAVYVAIILVGFMLTLALTLPYVLRLSPLKLTRLQPGSILKMFEDTSLLEALRVLIDPIILWLILSTCMGLLFIFTLFWVQALVIDDVGVLRAVRLSVKFVKKNIKATLGIASLWLISQGLVNASSPWVWFGGGPSGCSYWFNIPPVLPVLLQPVIATFFTLLLYVSYIDRTGRMPPAP